MKKFSFRALLLFTLFLVSSQMAMALVYFPPEDSRTDHDLLPEVILASEDDRHAESALTWDTSECGEIPFNVNEISKMKYEALHHFHCDVAAELELMSEEEVVAEETAVEDEVSTEKVVNTQDKNKVRVPKTDEPTDSVDEVTVPDVPSFQLIYFPPYDERDDHSLEPDGAELVEEFEATQEEAALMEDSMWTTYTCEDFAAMTYAASDVRMNALHIFHCGLDEVIEYEGDPNSLYEVEDNDVEMEDEEEVEVEDEEEESDSEDDTEADDSETEEETEDDDTLLVDLSELFEE